MTNTRKRYIHFAIMFLITVAICNCPPVGQITEYGMKVLAVFIAVLYGWIFIDLIWPSLFGFVVLGITGVMPAVGALAAGFGNMQFLMIFVTMVFAGALDQIGVTDFLSSWVTIQAPYSKMKSGHPEIAFLIASYALCPCLWAVPI